MAMVWRSGQVRVLLVEDDDMLGAATRAGLVQDGYIVDWIHEGATFLTVAKSHAYDAVLLDLALPDASGIDLLRTLRLAQNHTPVIVITARGQVSDRVQLLDLGADDYLSKPFDLDELSARIRAVTRRGGSQVPEALACGPLQLNLASHTATWRGAALTLTNKEFWLLETFLRNRNRVLSRRQLEEAVYGWGDEVESNAVEVHIHHLRKKISPQIIRTVRGVGYQFGTDFE